MLTIVLVVPTMREHAIADLEKDWERLGSLWAPLCMVGSLVATFALMAAYGAAGGVFVMGIVGFLKPVKGEEP